MAGPGFAPLYLGAPPALGQILAGLVTGRLAQLDFVDDFDGAAGLGKTCSCTLVLDHLGVPFQGGNAALYVDREFV